MRHIIAICLIGLIGPTIAGCGGVINETVAQDPCDSWDAPRYEWVLINLQYGSWLTVFTGEDGEFRGGIVTSHFNYQFDAPEGTSLTLEAYASKQGNTSAYLIKCGEIVAETHCQCAFPYLEINY